MKVELSANGCLKIMPETPIESYALGKWGKDFFGTDSRDATMLIEIDGSKPELLPNAEAK
jgi:hypothetical protein